VYQGALPSRRATRCPVAPHTVIPKANESPVRASLGRPHSRRTGCLPGWVFGVAGFGLVLRRQAGGCSAGGGCRCVITDQALSQHFKVVGLVGSRCLARALELTRIGALHQASAGRWRSPALESWPLSTVSRRPRPRRARSGLRVTGSRGPRSLQRLLSRRGIPQAGGRKRYLLYRSSIRGGRAKDPSRRAAVNGVSVPSSGRLELG